MGEVAQAKPLARYQRRSCAGCHATGEHQVVRVLSPDALQWRPGYQCATCATVQLLPLADTAPVACTLCGRVHQPSEPVCGPRLCRWCSRVADDPAHGMDGHVFEVTP